MDHTDHIAEAEGRIDRLKTLLRARDKRIAHLEQQLVEARQSRNFLRGFLLQANASLRVLAREHANMNQALSDIARQPEGDEQSAQAVAKEALATQRGGCEYPDCLDGNGRCHPMLKGECAGPRRVTP
jgi:septal ring factor EnvC (AmiA/AmiB activator)